MSTPTAKQLPGQPGKIDDNSGAHTGNSNSGSTISHNNSTFHGDGNGGHINNFNKYGGTASSVNNHGKGNQDFSGAKVNSGARSGDRNRSHTANNYGGRTVNNSGTVNGHGNGGFIDGNFDASTRNYDG